MHNPRHDLNGPRVDEPIDPNSQARALRRRLTFWRRTAWLLFGIGVLVFVVTWHRGTVRRRECRQSLEWYARQAADSKLDQAPSEVLESHWRRLSKGEVNLSAGHYALIVQNWLQTPPPGESLPLAACRDPHVAIFTRGLHVLFRDENGTYIEWLAEDEAAPILARLRRAHD